MTTAAPGDVDMAQRQLARAQARITILEAMIENKTRELFLANEELVEANSYLTELYRAMPGALLVVTTEGLIGRVNRAASLLLGVGESDLVGRPFHGIAGRQDEARPGGNPSPSRHEEEWRAADGTSIPVLVSRAPHVGSDGKLRATLCVAVDLRDYKRMEVELRHAQKLESLGQLAAGVAHEINTPMQFIGDHVAFLGRALDSLRGLVEIGQDLRARAETEGVASDLVAKLRDREVSVDLDFLMQRGPRSVGRALEGVSRVSRIVAAMKAFSHPSNERAPADINKSLEDTLVVARNEYKYVADVETSWGDLPAVLCHAGDMNQVFLNLIVNAAHAIESTVKGSSRRGLIKITTSVAGDAALIAVADNGCGIAASIRGRIFDPFFTTKEVGKGTGQGLTLARAIVDKHGGSLTFESEPGHGTTFLVRLPIRGGGGTGPTSASGGTPA